LSSIGPFRVLSGILEREKNKMALIKWKMGSSYHVASLRMLRIPDALESEELTI